MAILLLLSAVTFSSCMANIDTAVDSPQPPLLPLPSGPYKITGKIYNYSGQVAWAGPPAPIPSGYISTVDLSAYSPKMAVSVIGIVISIPFADISNMTADQYFVTSIPNYNAITFDFPSYMYNQQFSNISHYVINYIPATVIQKASFHLMTKYNTLSAGTGNDRIVDEYLDQL